MQKYSIKEETLLDIAGAIRAKSGKENKITPLQIKQELQYLNNDMEEFFDYETTTLNGLLKKIPSNMTPLSTSGNYMFYKCENLTECPSYDFMKDFTEGSYMFYGCKKIKNFDFGDLEGKIKTASYMFAESGVETITYSHFFDSLTSATGMFDNCVNLKYMPQLPLSQITNFQYTFRGTSIEEVGDLNLEKSTNIYGMFSGCKNLRKVGNINVPLIDSNWAYTFNNTAELEIGDVTLGKVTSAVNPFGNNIVKIGKVNLPLCTSFGGRNSSGFFQGMAVEEIGDITCGDNPSFSYMFSGITRLKKVPNIHFNGEVSSITGCFKDCRALEEIPYFPVNANSSLYETFYKCTNLKKIPTEWHFEEPSGFYYAFYECASLEDMSLIDLGKPSGSAYNAFAAARSLRFLPKIDCSAITDIDHMLSDAWHLEKVENLHFDSLTKVPEYIFANVFGLKKIKNLSFNKLVEPKHYLFAGSRSGWTIHNSTEEIDGLSLESMTNGSSFSGGLKQIKSLRKLYTPKLQNATYFFDQKRELENFVECDFGENITTASSMFNYCESMKKAPLICTKNITTMYYMFNGCKSLEEFSFYGGCDKLTNITSMFGYVNTQGVFKYDARYNYSMIINALPSGWTAEPLYIPQECTSLEIECDDVIGRATSALIKFKAITKGLDTGTGEIIEGQEITGEWWSDEFEENYSETDSVIREIKFDYMGIEATTTVTQLPREKAFYTIKLGGQWYEDKTIGNPDSDKYSGTYILPDVSTTAADKLEIQIRGYDNFKIYIKGSDNSSSCAVSATMDEKVILSTNMTEWAIDSDKLYGYPVANIKHLQGQTKTITIKKTGSGISAAVLIPKKQ